jgi:hypothetical protein
MTQVATDIGAASESLEVPFMPVAGIQATDAQAAIQAVLGRTWSNVVSISTSLTAAVRTFYFITGAAAPLTITLPTATAAIGDAIGVYMEDYTSTIIVTVDAGAGNWVGGPLYAQTHRIGAQGAFFIYRYMGGGIWITEQPIATKQIRFRSSSPTLSVIYDNSVLYVFSSLARTVTIPNDATDNLPIGYQVTVVRYGTGALTLVPTAPVTLNTPFSATPVATLDLTDMNSAGLLTKMGPNDWLWSPFGASMNSTQATIGFLIDGGLAPISTGFKGFMEIPFNCTINRVTMLADVAGSAVVDIWKTTYALAPPTVANTIVAAAPPTLTAAIKGQDATLTGWTTAVAAGDILGFNVNSAATIKKLTVSLKVTKL